mgnify:CR=1 FL=1
MLLFPADFIHPRVYKPFCEKSLTLPVEDRRDELARIILRMHHKRLNLWCINYTLDIQFDFSALVRYANAY